MRIRRTPLAPERANTARDGILACGGAEGRPPRGRVWEVGSWPAAPVRGRGRWAWSAWPSSARACSSTPTSRSSPAASRPPSTPTSAPSGPSRSSPGSACSCRSSRRPPASCRCPTARAACLRAALLTAVSLAAVEVVLVAALSPWLARAFGGHRIGVVAVAVLCVISAGQFVVRGALIGMDRMGRYALIMRARHRVAGDLRRRGRAAGRRPGQPRVRLDAGGRDRARARPTALPAGHPPHPPGAGARDGHAHGHASPRCAGPSRRCCSARCARSCCSTGRRC